MGDNSNRNIRNFHNAAWYTSHSITDLVLKTCHIPCVTNFEFNRSFQITKSMFSCLEMFLTRETCFSPEKQMFPTCADTLTEMSQQNLSLDESTDINTSEIRLLLYIRSAK